MPRPREFRKILDGFKNRRGIKILRRDTATYHEFIFQVGNKFWSATWRLDSPNPNLRLREYNSRPTRIGIRSQDGDEDMLHSTFATFKASIVAEMQKQPIKPPRQSKVPNG